ncbi:hypothetical protein ACVIU4_009896 [Bradyrhizobium barranii subsp. barranii]|nr:hypothetical protein [Bradyrhizobium japonicum]MCP1962089.1 hypothetical protein [Bradyrhizobium japonicum]
MKALFRESKRIPVLDLKATKFRIRVRILLPPRHIQQLREESYG